MSTYSQADGPPCILMYQRMLDILWSCVSVTLGQHVPSFSPVPVVLVPAPPALRRLRGRLGAGQRLALLQRRDRPLPSRQARRHPEAGALFS